MQIHQMYVRECLSTNDLLKSQEWGEKIYVAYSFHQTQGKGQLGRKWEAEPHQNIALSFSVPSTLWSLDSVESSMCIANWIRHCIAAWLSEKVWIKWPNDIIVQSKKISGILIEKYHEQMIIGVGINVNQKDFHDLPFATSLSLISQQEYDLHKLSEILIQSFKSLFPIENRQIINLYNHYLYLKNTPYQFQSEGKKWPGKIKEVNAKGKLIIENLKTHHLEEFAHGSVEFVL